MDIDFRELLGALSAILLIGGNIPYIRDILKHTTRPDMVTWFGWALLTGIGSAAQIAEGASLSVVVPIVLTLGSLLIALLALRFGHTRFTFFDFVCLSFGGLAIVLWIATDDAMTALVLSVLADGIVAMPTLLKTYRDPGSETAMAYFLFGAGSLIGIFASDQFNTQNLLYPLYLAVFNFSITVLAFRTKFGNYRAVRRQ